MNPEVEAIKKQRRDEVETLAREKFDAFHHDIAPHKKKAIETLKAFSPLAAEGQKLASDAATLQNPPQQIAGLIQDILNACSSVPMRINAALHEIDSLTVHDMTFEPEGQSRFSRLVFALNPGDVARAMATKITRLRDELSWLAKNVGVDSTVTIPAAPVSSKPTKVVVESR